MTLYLLSPSRRRKAARRIAANGLPASLRLRSAYCFGRNLALMLTGKFHTVLHGGEVLKRLKKGGVAIGYHFGPWEVLPAVLAKRSLRMGIVTRFYDVPMVDRFLQEFRSAPGIELFYADGPRSEVLRLVRFVKSGGVVGALIDGETFDHKFGTLERLIRKFNFPVVPVFALRRSHGLQVHVGMPLRDAVKLSPEDYFWFYSSRKIRP